MPQGVSSAPEEYQHHQNEALARLNSVEVIAEDMLCCGCGETVDEAMADHGINLLQVLEWVCEVNLKVQQEEA